MKRSAEATIALAEAAYDLRVDEGDWFPQVVEAAAALLDRGLGVLGLYGTRPAETGPVQVEGFHISNGPEDFSARLMSAMSEVPPEAVYQRSVSGIGVLSELNRPFLDAWSRHIGSKDAMGVTAIDPNGHAVHVLAPVPEVISLSPQERNRWRMLAAHLSSGLRLRRALSETRSAPEHGQLPLGADAIIDGKTLRIQEAVNEAQHTKSLTALRQAAVRLDKARGKLRTEDPEKALAMWWALLRGHWSMVEWFDTDDRRYLLAVPNPPAITDPRGLTKRESQVVAYSVLGESRKMVAYRLGISASRVSSALSSSMRKLGVESQGQLVAKLHALRASLQGDNGRQTPGE